ncbi:MAG: WXG100 family type VII secretion target [Lachnospiraceae bacterium]|nr:WXG100 family type VII secretion target [Lachnospiraceae bacterium]
MAITLKVKPEVMKSKAGEISTSIKSIEKELNEITRVVLGTKKYWEGDASNQHQKNYTVIKEDIPKILKLLEEHPTDLLKMAGLYEEAEKQNQLLSKQLPIDVISY